VEPLQPVYVHVTEPPKPADIPRVEPPLPVDIPIAEPPAPADIPTMEPPRFVDTSRVAPPVPVDIPRPDMPEAGYGAMEDSVSRDMSYMAAEGYGAYETPRPPSVDDYTDRYLDIEELYDVLSLQSKRTDTIFLVEEYLKTLPDSLPDDSRREIVRKIVAASGFDYDLLMGDGVLRVKMLKDYAERFARQTDEYIASRQAELDDLDQQIMRVRRLIETRKELHKKQFFALEAEAQRLKEILTFISG